METFFKFILDKVLIPVLTAIGGAILFRIFIGWRLRKIKDIYSHKIPELQRSFENFVYAEKYKNFEWEGSIYPPCDLGFVDINFWYKWSRWLYGVEKKNLLDSTVKLLKDIKDYEDRFSDVALSKECLRDFEDTCMKWAHCYHTMINLANFGGNFKVNRHIHIENCLSDINLNLDREQAEDNYKKRNSIKDSNLADNPKLMEMLKACSDNNS